jgi:hypothetical protein
VNAYSRYFLVVSSFLFLLGFFTVQTSFAAVPPPQPSCTITANPNTISVGGSIVLTWRSANATQASISHIGGVGVNGSLNLLPSSAQQTTFAGTFSGPGGTTTCSASVQVVTASGGGGTSIGNDASQVNYTGGPSYTAEGVYNPNSNGTFTSGSYSGSGSYNSNAYNPSSQLPPGNLFTSTANTNTTSGAPSATGGRSVSDYLVQCGSASANDPYTASNCDICKFGQLIQNIINFLIIVSVPLSAGLFAWAGILMFTARDNAGQRDRAKKIFFSVFMGLVVALSGYFIVQTVLNALLSPNFSAGGWRWDSLECSGERPRSSTLAELFTNLLSPTGVPGGVTVAQPNNATYVTDACPNGQCTEDQARRALQGAGVSVNRDLCTTGQTTGCTTLANESAYNIQQIVNLKLACGASCQVMVTGGGEPHGGSNDPHAGGTAMDLASTDSLNNYIRNNSGFTQITSFNNLTGYRDTRTGTVYTFEPRGAATGATGDHWHVDIRR